MFRGAWLLLLVGCNEIYGLDPTTVRIVDARPPCKAGTPFSTGVEVQIAGNHSVEAARFTRNRGVAYLALCPPDLPDPKPGCDLYTSAYSVETESFAGFSKLNGVSTLDVYDSYPSITSDNQHLLFGSERGGDVRIYVAATQNGSFDMPAITRLAGTGAGASNEPYIVGDGRVLYFSAQATSSQLYRMEGAPPTFGGQSRLVSGVDIANNDEYAPVVRDDELEMFFASGRDFTLDLFTATRASTGDAFGTPVRVANLSSSGNDWPVWITPDGCELYYISRSGTVATLYVAKR